MSKFVWNMETQHKSWRVTKDAALKEAKKIDSATGRRVEKYMKDVFDRGLGEKLDAAQTALKGFVKAWDLAKPKMDQPNVRNKFAGLFTPTIAKLDPLDLVLDSYRQALKSKFTEEQIPKSVVDKLDDSLKQYQSQADDARKKILQCKAEFDQFVKVRDAGSDDADVQDLIARYAPELVYKPS